MKLDKNKIKENKFLFIITCFMLLIGIVLASYIFDFTKETVEIEAKVIHTWHSNGKSRGPKMNVEWFDLNGDRQVEGSLANRGYLEEGDTYLIRVDAETQSEMTLSKSRSLIMFAIGGVWTGFCLFILIKCFGVDKGKKGD